MHIEAVCQFTFRGKCRCRLIQYNEIDAGERRLVQAKRFPDDTFDAVSRRRLLAVFLRNGETEPSRSIIMALPGEYGKAFVATSPGFFEDTVVVRLVQKPLVFPERESGRWLQL